MISSDPYSKKVDLQKASEILVSGNAVHLEAYDSISLLAKAHVLIDLKQESWSWRAERTNHAFGMPMPMD